MLISIIIPVYNVENYLCRCLNSILAQSLQDYDVILVDDGSNDSSGKLCDEYAERYANIHVVHQKQGGVSQARNTGLDWVFQNSDSQWIAFVDSDDWVHPDYLSALLRASTSTNLPFSCCDFVRTSGEEPPKVESIELTAKIWSAEDFFVTHNTNSITLWGKLYEKSTFTKLRFPVGLIHEDEFITYKLLFATDKIALIEAPLYYYFRNPTGIMGVKWSPKRLSLLDAYKERLSFLRSRNLKKAYKWQAMYYYEHVLSYKELLAENYPELVDKYAKYMKKHYRCALRHTRRAGQLPFHGNEHLYEKEYPGFMKFYWDWKALCKKVSKRK